MRGIVGDYSRDGYRPVHCRLVCKVKEEVEEGAVMLKINLEVVNVMEGACRVRDWGPPPARVDREQGGAYRSCLVIILSR